MSRAVIAVAALTLAGLTGCGTVQNLTPALEGQMKPYGGAQIAVEECIPTSARYYDVAFAMGWPFYIADVGLSAIGDTLTLPITGSVTIWRIVDAMNYMAEDHKRGLIFDSEWWQFWCNGEPTSVAQLPDP